MLVWGRHIQHLEHRRHRPLPLLLRLVLPTALPNPPAGNVLHGHHCRCHTASTCPQCSTTLLDTLNAWTGQGYECCSLYGWAGDTANHCGSGGVDSRTDLGECNCAVSGDVWTCGAATLTAPPPPPDSGSAASNGFSPYSCILPMAMMWSVATVFF